MDLYQQFIHMSRYSRWLPDEQRRETWLETVTRTVDYMFENIDDPAMKQEVFDAIHGMEVMPSMRLMMTAGPAHRRDNVASFNCSVVTIDDPRAFDEALYILCCGTGLGFSVEERFIQKLPIIAEEMYPTETVIVVADSKIGWASAFRELVSLLYAGKVPSWDTSKIRPEGAPLKTFGGRASGPRPLIDLFEFTVRLFKNATGRRLTSLECHDLVCKIADIVVVGGVRRSALISLGDLNDDRMRHAKSGQWWITEGQRALANISAVYESRPEMGIFMREWQALYDSKSGERGLFNRQGAGQFSPRRKTEGVSFVTNPCFAGDQRFLTVDGWRRFDEMVGRSVEIIQDTRVNGVDTKNGVIWTTDGVSGQRTIISPEVFLTKKNQPVYEIKTSAGRSIKATSDHLFATDRGMVETQKLVENDKLWLSTTPFEGFVDSDSLDFKIGLISGLWVSDGTTGNKTICLDLWYPEDDVNFEEMSHFEQIVAEVISSEETDMKSPVVATMTPVFGEVLRKNGLVKFRLSSPRLFRAFLKKEIFKDDCDWIHDKSLDCKAGFIAGMIYGDGSVQWANGQMLTRISQSNKERLSNIQLVLQEFDVLSGVYERRPAGVVQFDGQKEYATKASYELIVGGGLNNNALSKLCLFGSKADTHKSYLNKYVKLYSRSSKDVVLSVSYVGNEDVFCPREDVYTTLVVQGAVARRPGQIVLRPQQFCNLTEVVIRANDTEQDLMRKIRVATVIGTIQSSYTNFRYLRSIWKKNTEEERLLGVSLTGICDNPLTYTVGPELDEMLVRLREHSIAVNAEWADRLGISRSAAITTVKPSGTVSQLCGTSSGIHPAHNNYYIRRVRNAVTDPVSNVLLNAGVPCEFDVTNDKTLVFSFPQAYPNAVTRHDMSAIDQLELYRAYRNNWTEHNVSTTIYVAEHEWLAVGAWVYENFDLIGGVSFLPKADGDHVYRQAPYEDIDQGTYEALVAAMPTSVDWSIMRETSDTTSGTQTLSCAAGGCEII